MPDSSRVPLGPEHAAAATSLGCLSVVVVGLIVLPLVALVAPALGGDEDAWGLAVALPLQGLGMILAAAHVARHTREGVAEVLGLRPARRLWLAPTLLLAGFLSDALMVALRELAPGLEMGSIDGLSAAISAPGLLGALVVLGAVIAAPLSEELLFRGVIFSGVRARWGASAAVALSAALFGAWHIDPVHAVGAGALGLYLGWMRWVTGSTWTCFAAHALNNAVWSVMVRRGLELELPGWGTALVALGLAALLLTLRPAGSEPHVTDE